MNLNPFTLFNRTVHRSNQYLPIIRLSLLILELVFFYNPANARRCRRPTPTWSCLALASQPTPAPATKVWPTEIAPQVRKDEVKVSTLRFKHLD